MRGFGSFFFDNGNVKHFSEIWRYCSITTDQTYSDYSKATAGGLNHLFTTHAMQGGHHVGTNAHMELLR
jgi:hypothetical protein